MIDYERDASVFMGFPQKPCDRMGMGMGGTPKKLFLPKRGCRIWYKEGSNDITVKPNDCAAREESQGRSR